MASQHVTDCLLNILRAKEFRAEYPEEVVTENPTEVRSRPSTVETVKTFIECNSHHFPIRLEFYNLKEPLVNFWIL